MNFIPDHLLADIFEYLDLRTIKTAEKVCERWHQIITTSLKIVRKFTLFSSRSYTMNQIDPYSLQPLHSCYEMVIKEQLDELEENMKKFPYCNISFDFPPSPHILKDRYLEMAEKYFRRMEKIKFQSAENFLMMRTLSLTSSTLVELIIDSINDDGIDQLQPIELPKLKVIEIRGSTTILNLIKAEKVRELSLEKSLDKARNIESFMVTLPNLKSLKLKFVDAINLLSLKSFPFKLEMFKMQNSNEFFLDFLKKFLLPHRASLRKLTVDETGRNCTEFLEFAIGGLQLEILECRGALLEGREKLELLDAIPENSTIKDLKLSFVNVQIDGDSIFQNKFIKFDHSRVIKKCLALEHLKVANVDENLANLLMEIRNKNLKFLEFRICDQIRFGNPQIDGSTSATCIAMESLSVYEIFDSSMESLVNFASNFPNLKKLTIGKLMANYLEHHFDRFFQICTKIEEIEIKDLCGREIELYRALMVPNCGIKILKINLEDESCARDIKEIFKNVKCNFPPSEPESSYLLPKESSYLGKNNNFDVELHLVSDRQYMKWDCHERDYNYYDCREATELVLTFGRSLNYFP